MGLLRLAAFTFILWLGFKAVKILLKRVLGNLFRPPADTSRQVADMVQDPECKSYVSIDHAVIAEMNGEQLYFCSDKCRDTYMAKTNG